MPVYDIRQLKKELVTPQHSSAFGSLITGERIELGVLRYKAGEGAKEHAHPQEQILLLLKGRARLTLGAEVFDLGPGQAAHIPPHLPHSLPARWAIRTRTPTSSGSTCWRASSSSASKGRRTASGRAASSSCPPTKSTRAGPPRTRTRSFLPARTHHTGFTASKLAQVGQSE